MTDKSWFIARYDSYVYAEGAAGAALEKSRDAVAHAYADAVESGRIERHRVGLMTEARTLFDQFVKPERDRRKSSMRKSMEHLIDALNDETILGLDDPALQLSFPLGDGRDKTLRLWTQEDWEAAIVERYRNAAEVTKAASAFDASAQLLIAAMRRAGVRATGDLFA